MKQKRLDEQEYRDLQDFVGLFVHDTMRKKIDIEVLEELR